MNERIAISLIEDIMYEFDKALPGTGAEYQILCRIQSILDALKKDAAPFPRVEGHGVSARAV